MMLTRDELLAACAAEVSNYPLAAQFYRAGDPRLLAQLGSMATMLAMMSVSIDAASMEPFNKARDTTVLADATMKGILPFSRPARVVLAVSNTATAPLTIAAGRRLLDQQGRVYVSESSVTILAGATGSVNVRQMTTRSFQHTVAGSTPFYGVEIPASSDDQKIISGVLVSIAGVTYPYTPEFSNLAINQPGFALETDEYRRLLAKFGWANTIGIQPTNGTVIDFIVQESAGLLALAANAPFTFESTTGVVDDLAGITLSSVTFPGANPVDIQTLREWAKYPCSYDSSAVYLGNFDYLVRTNINPLRFLSVWNEQIEESVRGASINNINKLFVSAVMDGATTEWLQAEIRRVIAAADDSYVVNFLAPVETPVAITVAAQVSVVHDVGAVKSQINTILLRLYGRDSQSSKRGMMRINSGTIYAALKKEVLALQDEASDLQLTIPAAGTLLPEQYRYVTLSSITVNVTQATYNDGQWSH